MVDGEVEEAAEGVDRGRYFVFPADGFAEQVQDDIWVKSEVPGMCYWLMA